MFFTTFPHKIQLPVDINRFQNRKTGTGENPGISRTKTGFLSGDGNVWIDHLYFCNLHDLEIPKWYHKSQYLADFSLKFGTTVTCQSRREIVQYGRKQAWNVSRIQNHCMANHLWAEDFRPFFFVGHKAKVRTNLTLASHNFELKWSWYDLVLLPQPGCGSKVLFVPLQFLCEKGAQLYFCTCTGLSLNYEPVQ